MGNHRADRRSSRRPSVAARPERYVGRRVAGREPVAPDGAMRLSAQVVPSYPAPQTSSDRTFFSDHEPTEQLPLVPVGRVASGPGRRKAVKPPTVRSPLISRPVLKGLPSAPALVGLAALAVAAGGAITVGGSDLGSSVTASASVRPAGAVGGTSGTASSASVAASAGSAGRAPTRSLAGSVDSLAGALESRQATVSRDTRRDALADAADSELEAEVEQQNRQRNAALAEFADLAEEHAAEIELNLWQYPLDSVALTARFGQYGLWSSYHTGLDFNGDNGDPIYAIANGVVTSTGYDGAYGNKTVVTLEDGTELWYCHQTTIGVGVGETVRGGEVIGTVGSTGNVTGSHLHVEVRPGGGDPVDPYAAMQQHGLF